MIYSNGFAISEKFHTLTFANYSAFESVYINNHSVSTDQAFRLDKNGWESE